MRHERTRTNGRACPTLKKNTNIAAPRATPPLENSFFLLWKLPMGHSEAAAREKPIYPTRLWCNPHSIHAPPRRDRGNQNTCLDISLPGVCRSALSLEQWRLVPSKLEKLFEVRELEDQTGGLGLT